MNVDESEYLYLPEVPILHGLVFRKFRGEDDYELINSLVNIVNIADNIEELQSVNGFINSFINCHNFDFSNDTLVAQFNDQVIGFIHLWWETTVQGDRIFNSRGFVHPNWRRKHIGQTLLQWGERRLLEVASTQEINECNSYFQFWSRSDESGSAFLSESQGYEPIRHSYKMVRPLEEHIPIYPLPSGIEIRRVVPSLYKTIWEAKEESFRDHWSHRMALDVDYEKWLNAPSFQPEIWQVAWDGSEVAGMILNNIDDVSNEYFGFRRAWTDPICVRRPWRRRGLASALLGRSLQFLKTYGIDDAILRADIQNPTGAFELYKEYGFKPCLHSIGFRKILIL